MIKREVILYELFLAVALNSLACWSHSISFTALLTFWRYSAEKNSEMDFIQFVGRYYNIEKCKQRHFQKDFKLINAFLCLNANFVGHDTSTNLIFFVSIIVLFCPCGWHPMLNQCLSNLNPNLYILSILYNWCWKTMCVSDLKQQTLTPHIQSV